MINRYKYSLLISLVILYLSLKNANDLNKVMFLNIPYFDKIAHFCMYFSLMAVIILESGKIATRNRSLLKLAFFPFFYGILMEFLQGTITTTRSASPYDVVFNTLGIIVSILIWLFIRYAYKEKFK
jgi:VanZ family protein